MKLSGRRIRKAFEHMTPNVLNTVLPDDCSKKGVVIPMSEKKTMLHPVIKKIAAAAAMIALLFGIGSVGLMILVGGQTPQLSGDPSDTIEDPTEIPEGPASEEKALAYLRQLVKVPEKYTLTKFNLDPYTDMYHVTFTYQINGIDTADCCTLMMRTDGSLYFSQVYCDGEFDNIQVTQDMVQDAEEQLFDMYNLDRYPCTIIEFSHILWEDGVLSAAFNVQRAEGEFLSTYTVPLKKYDGIYDEEMAIKWAIKYAYRYLESEVFDVHCKQSDDGTYFDISFRYRTQKFLCKIDVNTGKVFDDRYEDACVFETEDITRITFSGFYGTGRGVDVPEENMAEIIAYLETFTFADLAIGQIPPGTDTIHIEIEYADGRIVKHGMNTVEVSGLTYYIQGGTAPECYDNIIADAVLEES